VCHDYITSFWMANDDAPWALGTDLRLGSLDFVFNEAGGGTIIGAVFPAPER
jgi:hypothetical protein